MKLLALAFAGTLLATAAFAGNSAPSQSTWHTPSPGAAYHGESYKNNTVAAVGPSGYNNIVTASYRNPEAGGSASYRSIQASATIEGFRVAAVGPSGYNNIVTASYAEPEAGNSFGRA